MLGYAVLFVLLAVLIAVSKVGIKSILRGMKPILIIVIITGLLNLFYTRGEGAPLVSFWIFTIYPEGIWAAVFMVLRIAMLITCTFLLTYTTSPILLTDGLEKLMGPLKTLHVPVHELSMMMSIALRFIPTLIECRCYHGGEGRTRLRQLKLKGIDLAALVFAVLLCVGIGVLRHFGL